MRRLVAIVFAGLGAVATAACPSKHSGQTTLTPLPGRHAPEVHSDAELVAGEVRDVRHGLEARIPDGWVAVTSFVADESGPPPVGELRARARLGPDPFCVIDLAVGAKVADSQIRETIRAGREIFYFASSESEELSRSVWTATTIPLVPGVSDIGYWIPSGEELIRIEGRFPNERLPECKAALDAFVASLTTPTPIETRLPKDGASARVNP